MEGNMKQYAVDWRDGSAAKSKSYFSRGHGFDSQHLTPVYNCSPRGSNALFWLLRTLHIAVHRQTSMRNIHTHGIKIKIKKTDKK